MKPDAPGGDQKFRVLIIEDDLDVARLVATSLAAMNLECRHAPNGEAGLQVMQMSTPHLVLLDLMLPGISGVEVCSRIRESSMIPVIVLTALDAEEHQVQGFKLGADDYLTKPFSIKVLAARVVANLRRAYRYDAPVKNSLFNEAEPENPNAVPPGWALCDRCGYMGPREKFEYENVLGRNSLTCPACEETDSVVFSLG